jgi:hypothetical protein
MAAKCVACVPSHGESRGLQKHCYTAIDVVQRHRLLAQRFLYKDRRGVTRLNPLNAPNHRLCTRYLIHSSAAMSCARGQVKGLHRTHMLGALHNTT